MLQAIFKSDFISETSTLSRAPSSSITLIIFAAPGVHGASELIDDVKFTGLMDVPSAGKKRNASQAGAVLPASKMRKYTSQPRPSEESGIDTKSTKIGKIKGYQRHGMCHVFEVECDRSGGIGVTLDCIHFVLRSGGEVLAVELPIPPEGNLVIGSVFQGQPKDTISCENLYRALLGCWSSITISGVKLTGDKSLLLHGGIAAFIKDFAACGEIESSSQGAYLRTLSALPTPERGEPWVILGAIGQVVGLETLPDLPVASLGLLPLWRIPRLVLERRKEKSSDIRFLRDVIPVRTGLEFLWRAKGAPFSLFSGTFLLMRFLDLVDEDCWNSFHCEMARQPRSLEWREDMLEALNDQSGGQVIASLIAQEDGGEGNGHLLVSVEATTTILSGLDADVASVPIVMTGINDQLTSVLESKLVLEGALSVAKGAAKEDAVLESICRDLLPADESLAALNEGKRLQIMEDFQSAVSTWQLILSSPVGQSSGSLASSSSTSRRRDDHPAVAFLSQHFSQLEAKVAEVREKYEQVGSRCHDYSSLTAELQYTINSAVRVALEAGDEDIVFNKSQLDRYNAVSLEYVAMAKRCVRETLKLSSPMQRVASLALESMFLEELQHLDGYRLSMDRDTARVYAPWSLYTQLLVSAPTLPAALALFKLMHDRIVRQDALDSSTSSANLTRGEFAVFESAMESLLAGANFEEYGKDVAADLQALCAIVELCESLDSRKNVLMAILGNKTFEHSIGTETVAMISSVHMYRQRQEVADTLDWATGGGLGPGQGAGRARPGRRNRGWGAGGGGGAIAGTLDLDLDADDETALDEAARELKPALVGWLDRLVVKLTDIDLKSVSTVETLQGMLRTWLPCDDLALALDTAADTAENAGGNSKSAGDAGGSKGVAGLFSSLGSLVTRDKKPDRRDRDDDIDGPLIAPTTEHFSGKTLKWLATIHFKHHAHIAQQQSESGRPGPSFFQALPVVCSVLRDPFSDQRAVVHKWGLVVKTLATVSESVVTAHPGSSLTSLLEGFDSIAREESFPSRSHLNYIGIFQSAMHKLASVLTEKLDRGTAAMNLLQASAVNWTRYVCFSRHPKYAAVAKLEIITGQVVAGQPQKIKGLFKDLETDLRKIRGIFKTLAQDITQGLVSAQGLKRVLTLHDTLSPAWEVIHSGLSDIAVVERIVNDADDLYAKANKLRDVMVLLMPNCEELTSIIQLIKAWNYLWQESIQKMITPQGTGNGAGFALKADENDSDASSFKRDHMVTPMPNLLLKSLNWLDNLRKSELFKIFWKDNFASGSPSDIQEAVTKWTQLFHAINDGSIQLSVLEKYGPLMLQEVEIFVRSAESVKIEVQARGKIQYGFEPFDGSGQSERDSMSRHPVVEDVFDRLSHWNHVRLFNIDYEKVAWMFAASRSLVTYEEHSIISLLEATLKNLCMKIRENGEWELQKLEAVRSVYWPLAKELDEKLLRMPPDLLAGLSENSELLAWLSTIRDDEDFRTSIEVARSMSETTAPPDLWDRARGSVNELYLSTIRNVRTYLHGFLYETTHPCESWSLFVNLVSGFNDSTDHRKIISDMGICSKPKILAALKLIIGTNKAVSSSSRLTTLYNPSSESVWMCSRDSAEASSSIVGDISLQYQVFSDDGMSSSLQYANSELADFQSSIILEKSLGEAAKGEDDNEAELVDKFLQQYSWMRRLSDALSCLYESGHFDYYPKFHVEMGVDVPVEEFRRKVELLEAERDAWSAHVQAVRSRYYFINFFDLKRCFFLLQLLRLDVSKRQSTIVTERSDAFESLRHSLTQFVSAVNVEYAHAPSNMSVLANAIVKSWNDFALAIAVDDDMAPLSNMLQLEILGQTLDATFPSVPVRVRPVAVSNLEAYVVKDRIERGVVVALGLSPPGLAPRNQYDQLLTLAAIQGVLPEAETCLCCTSQTSVEHASIFIRRWHRANQYGREGVMYSLVEADKLPYDVQHSVSLLLRKLLGQAGPQSSGQAGPLVIVAETEQCHLASQFLFNRVTNGILPQEKIAEVCNQVGAACHTSKVPGGGKSFAIRLKTRSVWSTTGSAESKGDDAMMAESAETGTEGHLAYAHIPINSPFTPHKVLISRIEERLRNLALESSSAPAGTLLHLDVASTCSSSLVGSLFSLAVLGVLTDVESTSTFSYDPVSTKVCIELACGQQKKSFSHCQSYGHVENAVSSNSLCTSLEDLLCGMGHEEFYATFSDRSDSSAAAVAEDAFHRLSYVLVALNLIAQKSGSFPTSFEISDYTDVVIGPEDAFELLTDACCGFRIHEEDEAAWRPTYWCIWSFVNILFKQFQALQEVESPISLACVPDTDTRRMIVTEEFDKGMKERVKGEMMAFIIQTARDFVCRLPAKLPVESNKKVGILLWNASFLKDPTIDTPKILTREPPSNFLDFTAEDLKLFFWTREKFDNDGQPVFKSPGTRKKSPMKAAAATYEYMYLYYRESENRWVIDYTVNYTGAVLAYSQPPGGDSSSMDADDSDNFDLERLVFEKRTVDCKEQVEITVKKMGANMQVTGFEQCKRGPGTKASRDDNGLYEPAAPLQKFDPATGAYKKIKTVNNPLRQDLSVECNLLDGRKLAAKIKTLRSDGKFDVTFDDASLNDGRLNVGLWDYMIEQTPSPMPLHYTKRDGPRTRHLYYDEFNAQRKCWVIAASCNAPLTGGHAYSAINTIEGTQKWQYFPPNAIEKIKIRYIVADELLSLQAALRNAPIDEVVADLDDASDLSAGNLVRWRDTNHESFLFSNQSGLLSFLSLDAEKLRLGMHPVLKKHLETNHIKIGEDLTVLSDRHWEILSGLTGVVRSKEDAMALMSQSFCLTGDSLMKILAIVHRAKCKIPVVLMGECGCGKTMLLSFLCRWLQVELISLDVHGGTTEKDIVGVFGEATALLDNSRGSIGTVFVFLDEVNTCDHMGLINEIVCHRSIYGRRIRDGIQVLAALNPYRKRSKLRDEMGLVFNVGMNPQDDLMSKLVYRVKPIPPTLKEFIFDFGNLEAETELLYIQSMIASDPHVQRIFESNMTLNEIAINMFDKFAELKGGKFHCKIDAKSFDTRELMIDYLTHTHGGLLRRNEVDAFAWIISKGQEYIRKVEGDPSVVSLRDVKRTLFLFRWFHDELPDSGGQSSVARAAVLAMAHVYFYRLSSSSHRNGFWDVIAANSILPANLSATFKGLSTRAKLSAIVDEAQLLMVNNLEIDDGISMNQALTENVFVTIVCILNKIPIFIVGKPGTSKTLAIQAIEHNLQGRQSRQPFWRTYPAISLLQYQCSPLSTTQSIKRQYDAAKSAQEHSAGGSLTVLLLDEVGLAENSPDMPLKVLHYMLVDPPVAIVGVSNWTLDSSKMNRAILLQRPEPTENDVKLTGQSIVEVSARGTPRAQLQAQQAQAHSWMGPLAKAYLQIYTEQKVLLGMPREFFGMRDYYGMAKQLRSELAGELTVPVLASAVGRNFGGAPKAATATLGDIFFDACFPKEGQAQVQAQAGGGGTRGRAKAAKKSVDALPAAAREFPPAIDLIRANLDAKMSRNLMVLSKNDTVLQLLFGCGIVDESQVTVLVGSRFKDDLEELYLIQQINKVKAAMAEGKVAILLNNDSIYESLYDVLNQRYVRRPDPTTGEEQRFLRLAIGSRSKLCPVAPSFKIIVVVKQSHAYEKLDLPLLNRFEKQSLSPADVLTHAAEDAVRNIKTWCTKIKMESGLKEMNKIFCGFYDGTVPSLVLSLTEFGNNTALSNPEIVRIAKQQLLKMATPVAVLHSSTLKALIHELFGSRGQSPQESFNNHFAAKSDFFSVLARELVASDTPAAAAAAAAATPQDRLLLFATRSPTDHFEICLRKLEDKYSAMETDTALSGDIIKEIVLNKVARVQLSHVTSERILSSEIEKFYADESEAGPRMLALLCDPVHSDISAIMHAQYLVASAFQVRQAQLKQTRARKPTRVVAFIVNLPPGIHNRERQFAVDMYAPWTYAFVDELISALDVEGPRLMQMLQNPVHAICRERISSSQPFGSEDDSSASTFIDLTKFVGKNFQRALAQCSVAPLVDQDDARGELSRVQMMKELLSQVDFMAFIVNSVMACLRSIEPELNGMFLHVRLANETDMGSLRKSLYDAIERILVCATAFVLRTLDENYNLSLLYVKVINVSDAVAVRKVTIMWIELAARLQDLQVKFSGFNSVCQTLKLENRAKDKQSDKMVANTGCHGIFACRFPFSEKLMAFVTDSAAVRENLESRATTLAEMRQALENYIHATLQPALAMEVYSGVLAADPVAYLHDFVATRVQPIDNITFKIQFEIVKAIIEAADPAQARASLSHAPAAVHTAYWAMESRIFRTLSACSVIKGAVKLNAIKYWDSSIFIPLDFETYVVTHLKDIVSTAEQSADAVENLDKNLYSLFLQMLLGSIENICKVDISVQSLMQWIDLWIALQPDMDSLFALMQRGRERLQLSLGSAWLQGLKWRLMAWKVILSEYLASVDVMPVSDSLLRTILMSQDAANPTSGSSLKALMESCCAAPLLRVKIIHCYVKKFMLPELVRLRQSGREISIAEDIFEQVGLLLQPAVFLGDLNEVEKQQYVTDELCLHRAAMDLVYFLAAKFDASAMANRWIGDLSSTIGEDLTLRAVQLLFERIEDDKTFIEEELHRLAAESDLRGSIDSYLPCAVELSGARTVRGLCDVISRRGLPLLQELAVAKKLLTDTASVALSHLKETDEVRMTPFPAVPVLNSFDGQLYVLTQIVRQGGKAKLVAYLRRDNLPCLPATAITINRSKPMIKSFDPFATLGGQDPYIECCKAVSQCVFSKSIAHLDTWSKAPHNRGKSWADKANILLASITSSVTANNLIVDESLADVIVKWMRTGFGIAPSSAGRATVDTCRQLLIAKGRLGPHAIAHMDGMRLYLQVHVAILAMSPSSGWIHALLVDPASLAKQLIPSMTDSEMAQLLLAASTDRDVGVYSCPNGHIYTIGDCTRPWVLGVCPTEGCGRQIGGQGHQEATGNKSLGSAHNMNGGLTNPGYMLSAVSTDTGYDLPRLGKLTTVVLRFIIHSVMLLSAELYPMQNGKCANGGLSGAAQLMYPPREKHNPERITRELSENLERDWEKLCTVLQMDPDDVAMGMHMILTRLRSRSLEREMTAMQRMKHEQQLERELVDPTFTSKGSKEIIKREKARHESENVDKQLQESLKTCYPQVMELVVPDDPTAAARLRLWRFRERVTFDRFKLSFELINKRDGAHFPVISAILGHEPKLSLAKYAADILAWQAVLFKHLKSGSVAREDANLITNQQFIEQFVPAADQRHALAVLEKYCIAFNATITQPNPLIECAPNIFAHDGMVDLYQAKGTSADEAGSDMNLQTSIAFSLPNRQKKRVEQQKDGDWTVGDEFVDPRGLCTISILDFLQDVQAKVVNAILKEKAALVDEAMEVIDALGTRDAAGAGVAEEAGADAAATALLMGRAVELQAPMFSISTPYELMVRQLLQYDRDTQLMPSVITYANQPLEFGRGELVDFDFARIESDLRDALRPSAQPFALAHREFLFKGEIKEKSVEATMLAGLSLRITQSSLSDDVINQIWKEIDTEPRLLRLSSQIEDCIVFLSSAGSSAWKLDGDTKLQTFVLEILLLDAAAWDEMACPTINSSVCLKHLKSLQRGIRRREREDCLFPDLDMADYGAPLTADQEQQLRRCARQATQLSVLVDAMEDFIWFKLSQQPLRSFPGRDYCLYFNLHNSMEAEVGDWFHTSFPQDVMCSQAYGAFNVLKEMCCGV